MDWLDQLSEMEKLDLVADALLERMYVAESGLLHLPQPQPSMVGIRDEEWDMIEQMQPF